MYVDFCPYAVVVLCVVLFWNTSMFLSHTDPEDDNLNVCRYGGTALTHNIAMDQKHKLYISHSLLKCKVNRLK